MKNKFEQLYPNPQGVTFRGFWTMEVRGPDGNIKQRVDTTNVVCTNGKDFLASFLVSAVAAASTFTVKYIAAGTGSTAETAADTALVSETARQTGTAAHPSAGVFRVVATFGTNSCVGAITEYGLFSTSTGGTLFARTTESVVNVGSSDTLTVTADITLS